MFIKLKILMADNTNTLEISCPFCKAVGNINVPVSVYSHKKWGVVKIQVPAGAICKEHQFIVLIDTKGNVRGYERIEYLKGPQEEQKQITKDILSLSDYIDMFGEIGFTYLLHAKIFSYSIFIVKNELNEGSVNIIDNYFDKIFPEKSKTSSIPINFIEKSDIDDVINNEDGAFIIESPENIIQIPWKEKIKFEETIVRKALEIIVKNEQLIILQQEVSKLINIAENAKDILEFYYDISRADFIDQLQKESRIPKINKNDLALYKLYIDRRYSPHYWDKIKKK